MFTRRGFLGRIFGGTLIASSGLSLQSSDVYAFSSSSPPFQGPANRSGDEWMNETRWGRENWKITHQTIEWPNKARIAFLCSVPFETFDMAERGLSNDTGSVSEVLYGGKAGVWRILDILDRHNIKGNFVTHAFCAIQFPEAIKAIVQRGHEIVGHFWANIREDDLSIDRDRELIKRSISTLERVSGKRPVAWVAPGWWAGPRTLEILVEEGLTSHANSPSSGDVPYTATINGKKIVVVVQETVLNDNGFFNNFNSPATYVEYLKRDFDRKYSEGSTSGKLFNFVLHAHVSGRPYMADAVDEILAYIKTFPDVWFTTRQPLVDWWLQKNYS